MCQGGHQAFIWVHGASSPSLPPATHYRHVVAFPISRQAVVVLVNHANLKLYAANVGDSRCILCRGGKALQVTIDHKPKDEKERIWAGGGTIDVSNPEVPARTITRAWPLLVVRRV